MYANTLPRSIEQDIRKIEDIGKYEVDWEVFVVRILSKVEVAIEGLSEGVFTQTIIVDHLRRVREYEVKLAREDEQLQMQQHDGKSTRGEKMDAPMPQEIEGRQIESLEIQLRRELDEGMTIEE
jgi:hypothetical protein